MGFLILGPPLARVLDMVNLHFHVAWRNQPKYNRPLFFGMKYVKLAVVYVEQKVIYPSCPLRFTVFILLFTGYSRNTSKASKKNNNWGNGSRITKLPLQEKGGECPSVSPYHNVWKIVSVVLPSHYNKGKPRCFSVHSMNVAVAWSHYKPVWTPLCRCYEYVMFMILNSLMLRACLEKYQGKRLLSCRLMH